MWWREQSEKKVEARMEGVYASGLEEACLTFTHISWARHRCMASHNCKKTREIWSTHVCRGKGRGFGEFLFSLHTVEHLEHAKYSITLC